MQNSSPVQSWMQQFLAQSTDSQLAYLAGLSTAGKRELLGLLTEYRNRAESLLFRQFPDGQQGDTPARHLYVKHLRFFDAGARFRARLFMAGNRVGKTRSGCYEDTLHLTGLYPHWWTGRRFDKPISAWVAGKTNETTRDILQKELFGNVVFEGGKKTFDGSGLIPKHCIGKITWRQGIQNLADTIQIRHESGNWSMLGLKSYQQGRGSFEGTAQHLIHLDEEPPQDVYTECLTRTATTGGLVLITFTPLEGTTEMVDDFVKKSDEGINFMVQAGWADAPHLTEQAKSELLAAYPKHEHEARTKGIPYAGSGLIFPVDEDAITVKRFDIPDHWPRVGGLDFGWDHPTAGVVLAWDRDNDVVYVIEEYREKERTPEYHSRELRDFGSWVPWAWPHDGLQHDKGSGEQLAEQYRRYGLNLMAERATWPDGTNGVEAGLMEMLTRMEEGRWKVFEDCNYWIEERRMYHREKGRVVKLKDDVISASRYALMMLRFATTRPRANNRSRPDWRA